MEIKIVLHSYTTAQTKQLDYIEFRFESGLSLFTETFQGLSKEGKKLQHAEVMAARQNLVDAGFKITTDLNGISPFS